MKAIDEVHKESEKKNIDQIKILEFLSKSAIKFLENISCNGVFQFIAKQVCSLTNSSIVIVNEYDSTKNCTIVRAISGPKVVLRKAARILKKNLIGLTFSFKENTRKKMSKGILVEVEGGLHDLSFNQMSIPLCQRIEKELNLGKIYVMPFVMEDDFLGTVAIITQKDELLDKKNLIEAFINQAAMALKRQKLAETLKKNEEFFRIGGMCASDLIYEWNLNNKQILEWYGSHEIIHKTYKGWEENIHPQDHDRVMRSLSACLKNSKPFYEEYRMKTKDGQYRFWSDRAIILYDKRGKPYRWIGACLDITKQKELERRKDDFISLASHELKTPLATIKALGQLLEQRSRNLKDIKSTKYINRINQQINRLVKIVEQLLNVSRIRYGKLQLNKEEFSIDKLIRETIEEIQTICQSHRIIKRGKVKALVLADKDALALALNNLLANAIKYSPSANKIIVSASTHNHRVTVAVRDFGVGVPKEERKRIFDPFYAANYARHEAFPGLGLGLFIAQKLIEYHGGRIGVKSNPRGSTFYFSLPAKSL